VQKKAATNWYTVARKIRNITGYIVEGNITGYIVEGKCM